MDAVLLTLLIQTSLVSADLDSIGLVFRSSM